MIVNFSIKNFGCIKDRQTLSFEAEKSKHLEDFYVHKIKNTRLLKIALIYGANASGKSTVLKALDFLRNLVLEPASIKTEELEFEPFLFDPSTPKQNSELAIEFFQNETKYYYEVEFNRHAVMKEYLSKSPYNTIIFKRETDLKNRVAKIKFGTKTKISKYDKQTLALNTLWNNTVLGGYLKTNIEIKELQEVVNWFEYFLLSVISSETNLTGLVNMLFDKNKINKNTVLNILKKADFNVSDIEFKKARKTPFLQELYTLLTLEIKKNSGLSKKKREQIIEKIDQNIIKPFLFHFVNGKNYQLPLEHESKGTQRYYGLAGLLALLIHDRKAVPIDELEASLHPDLFQHFLLTFLANARQSQIIATTHNREILNDKDVIRDDALWITDKTENAATELYSFADFDSSVIRNTTNRLNVYKSGKLGGIPNLSDYYLNVDDGQEK